jgi:arsenate reductase
MATERILFLCTGNSCRSQMAEAFTRLLQGERYTAFSAGVAPKGIDSRAVAVMAELGVDIAGQESSDIAAFAGTPLDIIVTVCGHAHETCPVFPGDTRVVHVGFDDPPRLAAEEADEESALTHYRRVRDEIRAFVEDLPIRLA